MPQRPKIAGLPPDLRAWLDRALSDQAFAGYEQLSDLLRERGYEISKSSLHRYGEKLERRLSAIKASTEAAVAIANAAPDDADERSAAVMALIQTDVFDVLLQLQEAEAAEPGERLKLLRGAAKSIAELSRASVNQRKRRDDVAAKVRVAADQAAKIASRGGLSPDTVAEIRKAVLGVA